MDFKLNISGAAADMTFDKSDTILNNVYFSLMVEKGTFFQNPDFGMPAVNRMKNTPRTEQKIKEYAREATRWIVDTGRATAIVFETERDPETLPGRIKLRVTATQANGQEITFEIFKEVV